MLKTDSKIILKILEIFNYAFIDLDRDKNIKKITKNELLLRIKNPNLFKNIFYKIFFLIPPSIFFLIIRKLMNKINMWQ